MAGPVDPAAQAAPVPEAAPKAAGPDPVKLHKIALEAQTKLEQLATGLAEAQIDPGAVQAASQMAKVTRKIVEGLARVAHATPPPAAKPDTMNSATDALQAALAAKRQGGSPQ